MIFNGSVCRYRREHSASAMASFADHRTEADESSHSLLSRRQSELESRYTNESGVYMSSFAATIFVAALVTIGVLMLTLLVALTVMLRSCQSRSTGVVELFKTSDEQNYCNALASHAELNSLGADEFPSICKQHSLQRSLDQFLRDLNLTVQLAESYFSTLEASDSRLDVVLMDADDLLFTGVTGHRDLAENWKKHAADEHPVSLHFLRLFLTLRARGWPVILFTRKHSRYRNDTGESLVSAGYGGWSSLIMRSDDELETESWRYISERRNRLAEEGRRIASVISSRMDAFRGSHLGRRNFKLANPAYYNLPLQSAKLKAEERTEI